jgi:hypothetical protein
VRRWAAHTGMKNCGGTRPWATAVPWRDGAVGCGQARTVKGIARVGHGLDGLGPVRRGAGPHSSKVSIFFSNTSTTPNLKKNTK